MTVIELPFPPSVNSIWRQSRRHGIYLNPKYKAWKEECDALYLANKRKWKPVKGEFTASLTFNITARRRRSDLDNRIKPVLDWLERSGLIENDNLCGMLSAAWGDVPGVHVKLTPAERGAIWCLGR